MCNMLAFERMWKKIKDPVVNPEIKDFFILAYDSSPRKGVIFLNITKEIRDAENVKLP